LDLRLPGGRLDTITGDNHFGARNEDPSTGVWTSVDPKGFAAGDDDLYGFEGNSPIDEIDPEGLQVDVYSGIPHRGSIGILSEIMGSGELRAITNLVKMELVVYPLAIGAQNMEWSLLRIQVLAARVAKEMEELVVRVELEVAYRLAPTAKLLQLAVAVLAVVLVQLLVGMADQLIFTG
jgi:RHS repeat-associated protein